MNHDHPGSCVEAHPGTTEPTGCVNGADCSVCGKSPITDAERVGTIQHAHELAAAALDMAAAFADCERARNAVDAARDAHQAAIARATALQRDYMRLAGVR